MNETLHALIVKLIEEQLAPIQARLDFLEDELNRLHEIVRELEHSVADLDSSVEIVEAPLDEQIQEESGPVEEVMMDHLLGHRTVPLPSASHVSLTVDLSKKKL